MRIHPRTTLGAVHYRVKNLKKQVGFYHNILGFHVLRHDTDYAVLGTERRELLHLIHAPNARFVRNTTGLYHTAFLVPSRRELALLLHRLALRNIPIHGTSNHGTHLAVYLADPEGNGIELAWDFPNDEWPMVGGVLDVRRMPREGIDVENLLSEIDQKPSSWTGLDPATRIGHIHLRVADLQATKRFYHDFLGWDVTIDGTHTGMMFFSAGGYHHHIGTNIWRSAGAPPLPADAVGLHRFTVVAPDRSTYRTWRTRWGKTPVCTEATDDALTLQDPAGNNLLITYAEADA